MLFWGYLAGAVLMFAGGLTEVFLGVDAERKSLESISAPLTMRRSPSQSPATPS